MCDWCKTYLDQMAPPWRRCRRRPRPSRCRRRPSRPCSPPSASGGSGAELGPSPTSSCARARSGPFSAFAWPLPADGQGRASGWRPPPRTAPAATASTRASATTCRVWIWEELWEVELAGEVEARGHKLRAPRGRLLRRVDAWSECGKRSRAPAPRAALHAAEPLGRRCDAAAAFEDGADLDARESPRVGMATADRIRWAWRATERRALTARRPTIPTSAPTAALSAPTSRR